MTELISFFWRAARSCRTGIALAALLTAGLAICHGQSTGIYKDIHDFGGNVTNSDGELGPDGYNPYAGVTFDSSGNMYGVTNSGGPLFQGMVWEVTSEGAYRDLHDFGSGQDGIGPDYVIVAIDASDDLYGTTDLGGKNLRGMLWEISSNGTYKDVHDFSGTITYQNKSTGPDGALPWAGVTFDNVGNMFGTTVAGGVYGGGIVWELSASGQYADLHDFGSTTINSDGTSGSDGDQPNSGVTLDSAGNLYGTTWLGGQGPGFSNDGMVWKLSGSAYFDLHDFGGTVTNANGKNGPDGTNARGGVTFDADGNMYGTTEQGGPNSGSGLLWEISKAGAYIDLHDFGGTALNTNGEIGADGAKPWASVTVDAGGNLYGTTSNGGAVSGSGMVWELTPSGRYIDLHDFGGTVLNQNGSFGADGNFPTCAVELDSDGRLVGTTEAGGPNENAGMVWSLTPLVITSLTFSPTTIGGLGTTTGTVSLSNPAPTGGLTVNLKAGASGYVSIPSTVVVTAGATSATFTIQGSAQRSASISLGIVASEAGSNVETILTIQGDLISGLTLSPSQIKWSSGSSTATLTLKSAAPPGGWIVNLHAGASGYVNMPSQVTIPAGATTTTFSISGSGLRFFTLNLGIFASDGNSSAEAILTIAGDAISGLTLNPSTILWTGTSTATLSVVQPAPPGGWVVNLHAGANGYVNLPTQVTIPAGSTSATFSITGTVARSVTINMGIYASDGPSEAQANLTLVGDSVSKLTLNPTTIGWSGVSTGTVTLSSSAPTGGWVVSLHAGASGYLALPTSVTIPAGSFSATISITGTRQLSATKNIGIFASDAVSSQEAILTIVGDSIASLTLSPSSVAPGGGSTGTVTLNAPAPEGGWVVNLTTGAPSLVGIPASVTVPAGASSISFSVTTKVGSPATSVGIFANDSASQVESILTIT